MMNRAGQLHQLEGWNGIPLLAGLSWEPKPSSGLPARIPSLGLSCLELITDTRMAQIGDVTLQGATSLLLAMAASPQLDDMERDGLWLFAAPLDTSLDGYWWVGGAVLANDGGVTTTEPALFGEQVFAGIDDLVQMLVQLCQTQPVCGLAIAEDRVEGGSQKTKLRRAVRSSKADIPDTILALSQLAPVEQTGDFPTFKPTPYLSGKALAGGSLAASLLLAGALYLPDMIVTAMAPEPMPALQFRDVVIKQGAFGQSCNKHLTSWWPRTVGWEIVERGCGLAGALPKSVSTAIARSHHQTPGTGGTLGTSGTPVAGRTPGTGGVPSAGGTPGASTSHGTFVAWARLLRNKQANSTLAQASGAAMLKQWPYGFDEQPDTILLWRQERLALTRISAADAQRAKGSDANGDNAALGNTNGGTTNGGNTKRGQIKRGQIKRGQIKRGPAIEHLWANRGDSVERSPDGRIVIQTASIAADIFKRLDQVSEHEPMRLTVKQSGAQSGGQSTRTHIELRKRRIKSIIVNDDAPQTEEEK